MPVFGRNRHEHFHGSPGLVGPGDVYDSRRPGAFGSGDMLDPYHPSYNRAHVAEPDGHYHYSEHHHSEYHYERHVHRSQGGRSRNAQKRAKARGKAEGYAEGMAVGFQEGWVQAVNGQEMHDRDLGFDARRLLDQEPWQSSSERRHGAVWGMYETPPPSYHSSRAPSPVGGAMCPYQEPPRGRRGPPVSNQTFFERHNERFDGARPSSHGFSDHYNEHFHRASSHGPRPTMGWNYDLWKAEMGGPMYGDGPRPRQ